MGYDPPKRRPREDGAGAPGVNKRARIKAKGKAAQKLDAASNPADCWPSDLPDYVTEVTENDGTGLFRLDYSLSLFCLLIDCASSTAMYVIARVYIIKSETHRHRKRVYVLALRCAAACLLNPSKYSYLN